MSKLQDGHAKPVYVFQPDKIPSPKKSLIVHIRAARILNISFFDESKVCIALLHNSFNSLISGCKYTPMLFPTIRGPGMIIDRIEFGCFMHNQGGRLYGTKITCQILLLVLIAPKGLKPSLANPNRTFRDSKANSG